jgi:hypothetical protein
MAYLTTQDARDAFARSQRGRPIRKSASQVLNESAAVSPPPNTVFDVFLSHCLKDAELVAGAKAYLEENGLSVYVDWIVDPQMDRTRVTPETANTLRRRMRASQSMIFATSDNSSESRWMPWELGYFDGFRHGRVAIMPLVASAASSFSGQEYLGLYPLVEKLPAKSGGERAYVTKGASSSQYLPMNDFKSGVTAFRSR